MENLYLFYCTTYSRSIYIIAYFKRFKNKYNQTTCEIGKIAGTDILEFRQFASFETYESLYLNALHKVFKYCRKRVRNPELLEILTDAYEAEYDWMCQRFQTFKEAE